MANGNPRDDYKEGKDFVWKEGTGGVKTRKFLSKAEKEAMKAPKPSAATKSSKAKPTAKTKSTASSTAPKNSPRPRAKPSRDTSQITTRKLSPATTGRGRGDGSMETIVRRVKGALDKAGKKDPYGIGEWEKSRAKSNSKSTTTTATPKGTKPFKGLKPTKAELDKMTAAQKLRWGVLFSKGSKK